MSEPRHDDIRADSFECSCRKGNGKLLNSIRILKFELSLTRANVTPSSGRFRSWLSFRETHLKAIRFKSVRRFSFFLFQVSQPMKPGVRGRYKEYETNGPLHRHACSYCAKSFQKPSDLSRHVRTHTDDRPFSCEKCHKTWVLLVAFSLTTTVRCCCCCWLSRCFIILVTPLSSSALSVEVCALNSLQWTSAFLNLLEL